MTVLHSHVQPSKSLRNDQASTHVDTQLSHRTSGAVLAAALNNTVNQAGLNNAGPVRM